MGYRFIKTPDEDNRYSIATVSMDLPGEITIPELCEHFTEFLRGCGFVFDGEIDIVEQEEARRDEDNLGVV